MPILRFNVSLFYTRSRAGILKTIDPDLRYVIGRDGHLTNHAPKIWISRLRIAAKFDITGPIQMPHTNVQPGKIR